MGFEVTTTGDFKKTETFLTRLNGDSIFRSLDRFGQLGVNALASATPTRSGLTASSWYYQVIRRRGRYTIEWLNHNTVNGANVAILIQYGHGTGTGGYVRGRDFINPAIQPIFDQIANDVWNEVTRNG